MRRSSGTDRPWILTAWLIIAGAAILSAAYWPVYPYFLDSFYHMTVVQGFAQAGGVALRAFWEAAPEGHPQLYPPLFHLLFVPADLLGIDPITVERFWSWAAFPFFLLIAWGILRRTTNHRLAALILISLATPYTFFLCLINNLPATLSLAALLGITLALERKRWRAGGILLGLAFWLHAGIPWLIVLSVAIFGALEPSYRKVCVRIIALGIFLHLPWLLHLLRHLGVFHLSARGEDLFLDIAPISLLLGMVGISLCWVRRGIDRFLVAMALGFLPMVLLFRFRYLSAQGQFPWLLLAGIALEKITQKIRPSWGKGLLLAALALGSPSLFWCPEGSSSGLDFPPQGLYLTWADTTGSHLAGRSVVLHRPTGRTVFHEKYFRELARWITAHTAPDELIYCNQLYVGFILNNLTHRAVTNRTFREIDGNLQEETRLAKLIVWMKNPTGATPSLLEETARTNNWQLLGETEIATLYRNPLGAGRRRVERNVMPWWLGVGLGLFGVVWVIKDLRKGL